jgi:hypothetical protein
MRWLSVILIVAAAATPAAARELSRADAFCPGFRAFVAADLPASGERSVTFLPMGMSADSIDMYAPMQGDPTDDAAHELYGRVAWLTHYELYDEFAGRLGDCLKQRLEFAPLRETRGPDGYRAGAVSRKMHRRITIEAARSICSRVVQSWIGNSDEMCVRVTVKGK